MRPRMQNKGEMLKCPHCWEEQDGKVEDFVILGKLGAASMCEDKCISCDEYFEVEYTGDDTYEITPT